MGAHNNGLPANRFEERFVNAVELTSAETHEMIAHPMDAFQYIEQAFLGCIDACDKASMFYVSLITKHENEIAVLILNIQAVKTRLQRFKHSTGEQNELVTEKYLRVLNVWESILMLVLAGRSDIADAMKRNSDISGLVSVRAEEDAIIPT